MGLPYSREINAAFEQVTPLVAAGYKVLQTTKNISILLAVIQVLTVLFLALILVVLVMLMYCVNPDLERERKQLITPFLQWLASISLWDIVRGIIGAVVGTVTVLAGTWYLFVLEHRKGVEHEGNEDADKALEELEGEDDKKKGKKGKGKEAKNAKDDEKAEEKKGKDAKK